MKSPARLGESAPSTSTPSTDVECRSAGLGAATSPVGISPGSTSALMGGTLGDGADSVTGAPPYAARTGPQGQIASPRE
ncbi:hypothetical protein GCM10009812_12640 [Nocardioides marinus]